MSDLLSADLPAPYFKKHGKRPEIHPLMAHA